MTATVSCADRTDVNLKVKPKPMRVGFVMHVMQVAGAEVLVREIIHQLTPRIEPTIFCLDALGAIGEELQSEGVRVITLDRRPGRDWGLVRRFGALVRDLQIDLLHAHQYTPLFYAALAKVLVGGRTKVLFTEHGRHYPDIVSWKRRLLNKLLFARLTDATTAVCDFTRQSLIDVEGFPEQRIETINNGIEVARYGRSPCKDEARSQLGLQRDRRYVTHIARFHPVKDHTTLVRAFSKVAAARNDVDLLLVGDGPCREATQSLAVSLGIADRVIFLGVRNDVPALLSVSDVFVLTSVSEASSLTLLEAMASGVPCVVTRVGGNPELVRDGVDGILVPRGDCDAVAAGLNRLLDDSSTAEQMGASGAKRVREQFELAQAVEHYWDVYQRLCPPLPQPATLN